MNSKLPFALVSALGFTLASCGKPKEEASVEASHGPPVPVQTTEVTWSEQPLFEASMGAVQPFRRADVSAKVTGRVLTMMAVPGKRAEEGELLAEIDAAELRSEAGL
jgi:multidrug efflux pump subunit AcrA (membrane-fusion protein)